NDDSGAQASCLWGRRASSLPKATLCRRDARTPHGPDGRATTDMKSFTDLFIKRPVLAMVVSFVILIAGSKAILPILFPKLAGLGGLNVRQYPRSDIASIVITTVYVGADAELVRGFITTPLERAIAAADGIDYIQSQSRQGQSVITARLKLN